MPTQSLTYAAILLQDGLYVNALSIRCSLDRYCEEEKDDDRDNFHDDDAVVLAPTCSIV